MTVLNHVYLISLIFILSALIAFPPHKAKSILSWIWKILLLWAGYVFILGFLYFFVLIVVQVVRYHVTDAYGVRRFHDLFNGIFYESFYDLIYPHYLYIELVSFILASLLLTASIKKLLKEYSWKRKVVFIVFNVLVIAIMSFIQYLPKEPLYQAYFGSLQDQFVMSSYYGNEKRVKYLLTQPGVDINAMDSEHRVALIQAAKKKRVKVIRLLLQYPVDEKLKLRAYGTALCTGDIATVREFYKNGIDINTKWPNGSNSLMIGYSMEDLPLMKYLVEQGIDLKARDTSGRTILNYAAENWHPALFEYLLTKVPDQLNIPDNEGNTPLLKGIYLNDYPQNVKMLINQGADINLRNKKGESVLYYSIINDSFDISSSLLEKGADWHTTKGSDIDVPEKVIDSRNSGFIDYFLTKTHCPIEYKNSKGNTLLHIAVANEDFETVKYLLAHGANAKVKDNDGKGLLSMELECISQKERESLYKILAKAGATY